MQISGAQMVIESLIAEDVSVVFGYPGGAIMNVYDEIYKQDGFQHILARHEQAAIHAAEGYSKSTGKVGVAMITSGRFGRCLYGFHPYGRHIRAGAYESYRNRCFPGD